MNIHFPIKTLLCLTLTLSVISCKNNIAFDSYVWKKEIGDVGIYPVRISMVDDLTKHHKLTALKTKQLVDMLGEPNVNEGDSLYVYEINTEYDGIDPDYFKELRIIISKDSLVHSFEIYEWHKGDK